MELKKTNELVRAEAELSNIPTSLSSRKITFEKLLKEVIVFKENCSKFNINFTIPTFSFNSDSVIGYCNDLIKDINNYSENIKIAGSKIGAEINKSLGNLGVNIADIKEGYSNSFDSSSITSLMSGTINENSVIAGFSFVIDSNNYINWYGGNEYSSFDEFYAKIREAYPNVDIDDKLKVLIKTDDSPIAWIDYKTLFNTKENSTSSSPNNTSTSTNDKSDNTSENNEQTNVEINSEDKPSSDSGPVPQNNANPSTNSNGVIDTSVSNYKMAGYTNLTEEEIATLAYIANDENGGIDGIKVALSLMCNLYEREKDKYSSVYDYVQNRGWFSAATGGYRSAPSSEYYEVARDILVNGNHYLPSNVVEHDWEGNIISASNRGSQIDVYDRGSYIPGVTEIRNEYGSIYTFVGFAPNGGDPFGYLTGYWK